MLTGKVCLVTGAGSGMGRATALEMSRQGARAVIASDVNEDGARRTVSEIREQGGTADYIHCDVSDSKSVRAMMSQVDRDYGLLDVLHNNAGVVDAQLTDARTVYDIGEEVWDRIFGVNVKGQWLCMKHGRQLLMKSDAGVIINCASVSSFVHFEGESAYVASKSAVLGLTRTIATDLAPFGIRCVAYAPGTIATPMIDRILEAADDPVAMESALINTHLVRRIGLPEDIAKLVCFLASNDASFINGSVHNVDGGMLAWRDQFPD
jgi:NAD(P)-dependent dehydrogenase (short-subunit alcohol dehydrogenase family)